MDDKKEKRIFDKMTVVAGCVFLVHGVLPQYITIAKQLLSLYFR
jgi:hypothetical protein